MVLTTRPSNVRVCLFRHPDMFCFLSKNIPQIVRKIKHSSVFLLLEELVLLFRLWGNCRVFWLQLQGKGLLRQNKYYCSVLFSTGSGMSC